MGEVIPLESAVVFSIQRLLKSKGAWEVKTSGVAKVGCPDILCCYRGIFVAIECKRPKIGKVTAKQHYELGKITDAGGVALIATSKRDVEKALRLIDMGLDNAR